MKKAFVFILFTALGACGGGGGSTGTPASPAPTVKITTTNAPAVSATSMASDSVTTNVGGLSVLTTGSTTASSIKLTDFTWQVLKLDRFGSLQAQTDVSATYCPAGGYADQSGGSYSGSLTFVDCNTGGVILNGSIGFTVSGSANNFTATATYTNFTFTDTTTTISVTVNASLSISYMSDGTNSTLKSTVTSFDMDFGTDYVHLYNMSMTVMTDGSGNTTTDFDYTFESSFISGVVRVTTAASEGGQSLTQIFGDMYPNSGAVVIIGNGSRARVTISGSDSVSNNVLLEVDENGDGVYDTSTFYTWPGFTALSVL